MENNGNKYGPQYLFVDHPYNLAMFPQKVWHIDIKISRIIYDKRIQHGGREYFP